MIEIYEYSWYNKLSILWNLIFEDLLWYIEVDVKVKCIENGTTQAQIAEDIQTTKSYVNRVIKKPNGVVNNTFVQMMEALGYDIELTYVKREG